MGPIARRAAALIGGAAIVTMVGLTASCAQEKKAPETTTATTATTTAPPTTTAAPPTTTAAPPSPTGTETEKSINPTGGNLFTPPIQVPGPQTPVPGNEPGNKPGNK